MFELPDANAIITAEGEAALLAKTCRIQFPVTLDVYAYKLDDFQTPTFPGSL